VGKGEKGYERESPEHGKEGLNKSPKNQKKRGVTCPGGEQYWKYKRCRSRKKAKKAKSEKDECSGNRRSLRKKEQRKKNLREKRVEE